MSNCLQVSSTSDEQQFENLSHLHVAASNCPLPPLTSSLFQSPLSLAGSVIRGHLLRRRPLIPTHKAKPPSSAQLLKMLHQPAFKDAFTASSSIVVIVQSLSQPHSSLPVWQPGYCPRTFFRLAGRFLTHIPRYSDRQARKPYTT